MKLLAPSLILAAVLCGCASGPSWKHQAFAFSIPADPPAATARTNLVSLSRVSISPLFQSRSFTYRTGDDRYEQDPYAGFIVAPDRALAESIRVWLRAGGAVGRVLEPGSGLTPTLMVEASITELYGDLRNPAQPMGALGIHFIIYHLENGRSEIALDTTSTRQTPMAGKTPAALMAAWDADLREIMGKINSAC